MKFYQAWKISLPASNYDRERHASDSDLNNNNNYVYIIFKSIKQRQKILHNW